MSNKRLVQRAHTCAGDLLDSVVWNIRGVVNGSIALHVMLKMHYKLFACNKITWPGEATRELRKGSMLLSLSTCSDQYGQGLLTFKPECKLVLSRVRCKSINPGQ